MREVVFDSFEALARHSAALAAKEPLVRFAMRRFVASAMAHEMRSRIGNKERLRPYLKPGTVAERVRKGFTPDDTLRRSGRLQQSIVLADEAEMSIAGTREDYAVAHELGGKEEGRPPKRSFAKTSLDEQGPALRAIVGRAVGDWIAGGIVPNILRIR